MAYSRHDFGLINTIRAEAIGVPGQRTFRLLIEGYGCSACLWLEKNQLLQLSIVILQMLSTLPAQEPLGTTHSGSEYSPSDQSQASMEFNVGRLGLGHDPDKDLFIIEVHDRDIDQEEEALLVFWSSRSQLEGLANEAQAVCAAGRPQCPLCDAPIGEETHVCPKSNGHHLA